MEASTSRCSATGGHRSFTREIGLHERASFIWAPARHIIVRCVGSVRFGAACVVGSGSELKSATRAMTEWIAAACYDRDRDSANIRHVPRTQGI